MSFSRRAVLLSAAVLGAAPALAAAPAARPVSGALGALGLDASALGLRPGSGDDQSAALGRALAEAARREAPLLLPPGRYRVSGVALPEGARLVGVPGATRLVQAGEQPLLLGRGLKRSALVGLTLEGLAGRAGTGQALALFEDVADLLVADAAFVAARASGLKLVRCGGRVATSRFEDMGDVALHSLDATGLSILDNSVERCGNNGIQVWRSAKGDDGTIVRGNRIANIRFEGGGTGQNGNGINVYRAGGVVVEGNSIRDCALSAVRNNSGSACQIIGNNCARLGETAIWSEFAFEGAVVANNVVEDAATGISITNLDHGGRLAVCTGNLLRRFRRGLAPWGTEVVGGVGIHAEAETSVTGNVVEGAVHMGISAGWSFAMRNLVVSANMIREAPVGIGVSLVPRERNALIAGNVIAGANRGAVVGFEYDKAVTGDLTRTPDERAAGIRIEGNATA